MPHFRKPHGSDAGEDEQVDAANASMGTAYRMQTEAPEVFDVRKESAETPNMYGEGTTARGCLQAVRLVEKGGRMVYKSITPAAIPGGPTPTSWPPTRTQKL